jgi:DNA-binding NtrC family response regulator
MLQMSSQLIHQLQQYNWPGNIRELEHLIERAVLLTTGDTIHHIDLPVIRTMVSKDSSSGSEMVKTIDEMEKEHILNILGFCKGKISGAQGAATLLGVPPSTLHSKMKRLGIQRKYSE